MRVRFVLFYTITLISEPHMYYSNPWRKPCANLMIIHARSGKDEKQLQVHFGLHGGAMQMKSEDVGNVDANGEEWNGSD